MFDALSIDDLIIFESSSCDIAPEVASPSRPVLVTEPPTSSSVAPTTTTAKTTTSEQVKTTAEDYGARILNDMIDSSFAESTSTSSSSPATPLSTTKASTTVSTTISPPTTTTTSKKLTAVPVTTSSPSSSSSTTTTTTSSTTTTTTPTTTTTTTTTTKPTTTTTPKPTTTTTTTTTTPKPTTTTSVTSTTTSTKPPTTTTTPTTTTARRTTTSEKTTDGEVVFPDIVLPTSQPKSTHLTTTSDTKGIKNTQDNKNVRVSDVMQVRVEDSNGDAEGTSRFSIGGLPQAVVISASVGGALALLFVIGFFVWISIYCTRQRQSPRHRRSSFAKHGYKPTDPTSSSLAPAVYVQPSFPASPSQYQQGGRVVVNGKSIHNRSLTGTGGVFAAENVSYSGNAGVDVTFYSNIPKNIAERTPAWKEVARPQRPRLVSNDQDPKERRSNIEGGNLALLHPNGQVLMAQSRFATIAPRVPTTFTGGNGLHPDERMTSQVC